jgi:hypothetical protein
MCTVFMLCIAMVFWPSIGATLIKYIAALVIIYAIIYGALKQD